MKVVLLKDVAKVGDKGQIVEVTKGYGVNHLIPKGLAAQATQDAINRAKVATKQKKEKEAREQDVTESLAKRISGRKFQIRAKASKGGRLYGSLDAAEVAAELVKVWKVEKANIGVSVDLAQPVRDTGKYPLEVTLSGGKVERKVDIIVSVVVD